MIDDIKTKLATATGGEPHDFTIKEVEHAGHPLYLVTTRTIDLELADAAIKELLPAFVLDTHYSGRVFSHDDQPVT